MKRASLLTFSCMAFISYTQMAGAETLDDCMARCHVEKDICYSQSFNEDMADANAYNEGCMQTEGDCEHTCDDLEKQRLEQLKKEEEQDKQSKEKNAEQPSSDSPANPAPGDNPAPANKPAEPQGGEGK